MVFADELQAEADRFTKEVIGEPFIGVHLRRSDFLFSRKDDVASIPDVIAQIRSAVKSQAVSAVFVSTDARWNDEEFKALGAAGLKLFRYPHGQGLFPKDGQPLPTAAQGLTEGQVAIVDQLLHVRSQYFIGTSGSTFSGQIYKER